MEAKIFMVDYDGYTDSVVALNIEQAIECSNEFSRYSVGDVTAVTELPKDDWKNHKVKYYEDNNLETEPYYVTYEDEFSYTGYAWVMASTNPDIYD